MTSSVLTSLLSTTSATVLFFGAEANLEVNHCEKFLLEKDYIFLLL